MTGTETAQRSATSLDVRGLFVAYGDHSVLHGVDITVQPGTCVAVLGANGAGKSTLLNAIAGAVSPTRGSITLGTQRVDGLPSHQVSRRGLCYVPEGRGIFPDLTVKENLRLSVGNDPARHQQFFEHFPALAKHAHRPASGLSGGEQQMLALAPALVTDYRLLMVDELSLGLAPIVVDHLFDLLTTIREQERSILLVEQFAQRALDLCDVAYVIRKGEVVFEGDAEVLRDNDDHLHSLYLGDGT